jgi:hypothetical protein
MVVSPVVAGHTVGVLVVVCARKVVSSVVARHTVAVSAAFGRTAELLEVDAPGRAADTSVVAARRAAGLAAPAHEDAQWAARSRTLMLPDDRVEAARATVSVAILLYANLSDLNSAFWDRSSFASC